MPRSTPRFAPWAAAVGGTERSGATQRVSLQ